MKKKNYEVAASKIKWLRKAVTYCRNSLSTEVQEGLSSRIRLIRKTAPGAPAEKN
jgi:transposase